MFACVRQQKRVQDRCRRWCSAMTALVKRWRSCSERFELDVKASVLSHRGLVYWGGGVAFFSFLDRMTVSKINPATIPTHVAASFPNPKAYYVVELIQYLSDGQEDARVRAIPGGGTNVPVWILGSSLYGAQLAAHLGLPYAFASHFAPAMLEQALEVYRRSFEPSAWLAKPYVMIAAGVCGADTAEEAEFHRSSQKLGFARLRSGMPGKLPLPVEDVAAHIPAAVLEQVEYAMSCSAHGSPQMVAEGLARIVESYQPDELMVTGMIHNPAARIRSFEIAAEALTGLVVA